MSPEISVIIPTYNRASMVVEAVESVLAQDMTDFELIVINDGSTDETEERLSVYGSRLKYYQQENAGVSAARNRTFARQKRSGGEMVAGSIQKNSIKNRRGIFFSAVWSCAW
jgi:glycosyltransferase involved in cell wall biosynthesis